MLLTNIWVLIVPSHEAAKFHCHTKRAEEDGEEWEPAEKRAMLSFFFSLNGEGVLGLLSPVIST